MKRKQPAAAKSTRASGPGKTGTGKPDQGKSGKGRARAKKSGTKKSSSGTTGKGQRSASPAAEPAGTGDSQPLPAAKPVLLSGGNPQIAKADGDAPVQASIAAMPGWKQDIGRRLDELIVRTVPQVQKAVRWNTPLYGIHGQGWFLGYHCFNKYVKVTFFRGASFDPPPPVESKDPDVRYLDLRENDPRDELLLANWIRQAAALPGWIHGSAGP